MPSPRTRVGYLYPSQGSDQCADVSSCHGKPASTSHLLPVGGSSSPGACFTTGLCSSAVPPSHSEGSCWSFNVSWESQPPHFQVSGRAAGSLWGERKSNVLLPERNGPQILSPWQDVEDRNHKLAILGRLTQTLYFRPLVQPRIFIASKENLGLGTPAEWGQELWLSHSRSLGHRTIRKKKNLLIPSC